MSKVVTNNTIEAGAFVWHKNILFRIDSIMPQGEIALEAGFLVNPSTVILAREGDWVVSGYGPDAIRSKITYFLSDGRVGTKHTEKEDDALLYANFSRDMTGEIESEDPKPKKKRGRAGRAFQFVIDILKLAPTILKSLVDSNIIKPKK